MSQDPGVHPAQLETAPTEPESRLQLRDRSARTNILFFFAVILSLFVAWHLLRELEILYVAALFAVVLMPLVNRIAQLQIRGWHPPRLLAIVLLLVFALCGLSLFFTLGLPPVVSDLHDFASDLPQRIPIIAARVKAMPIASRLGGNQIAQLAAHAENAAGAVGSYLFNSLPDWFGHLFDILTGLILCLYFMLEGEHAYAFFLSLFEQAPRQRLDRTLKRAEQKMSKWLLGQGLLMLILGVFSTIVFGLLHVRYFILLGALMGLFNLIPVAGAVMTVTLAAGVAAIDSWGKMSGVLIFYVIYLNVENVFLIPRIMRSSVNLMGLTVLVALLIGTSLAGIVGALVAVPTAALISVLLDEYAVKS